MKKILCVLLILLLTPACSSNESSEITKNSISSPTQTNKVPTSEPSNTPYSNEETQEISPTNAMMPDENQEVVFDDIKNEDTLPKEIIFADINNDKMPERIVLNKLDDQNCKISVYDKENKLLDESTIAGEYGYGLENIYTKSENGDSVDDILIPSLKTAYSFKDNKLVNINCPSESIYKSDLSVKADFLGSGESRDVVGVQQKKNLIENKNSTILSFKNGTTEKEYSVELKESFLDRNINNPALSIVQFGEDTKKSIEIDNSLIYSFDENNSSEPMYLTASRIKSKIEDLVCLEVDKNKVVLWPKNNSSPKTTIDISGNIACCDSSDIPLDKIKLVDSGNSNCVDYNKDGKNELCKTYYLKMPFQVLFNLEGPLKYNYGDIAKVEAYYSFKGGIWKYVDTKIIPKYKKPLREMERYDFFNELGVFNGGLRFKSNPKALHTQNTQSCHSGLSIYYNVVRDLDEFSLTSPYFLMSNGLCVGQSRENVLRILGIPDGGFSEDNTFSYYFGSPPGCYMLKVDFNDDFVSKISLDSWLVYD